MLVTCRGQNVHNKCLLIYQLPIQAPFPVTFIIQLLSQWLVTLFTPRKQQSLPFYRFSSV